MRRLLRRLLLGLCALASCAALPAAEFPWPGHGSLALTVPPGWDLTGHSIGGGGAFAFTARPKSGAAATLQITVAHTPPESPVDPARLTATLEAAVHDYLAGSVEQKFSPQPLPLAQGSGVFVQFTDASLVGQPPQPDNFKVIRTAMIALDDHALALASLQFNDPAAREVGEMMAALASLRYTRTAPPAAAGPFRFSVAQSRLELRFPEKPAFSAEQVRDRYFLGHSAESRLTASGWFEPAGRYGGLQKFWRGESAALTKNGFAPQGVEFARQGDWEVIHYHQDLPGDIRMCHLRAELVRAGTWIDLHLSATGAEPLAALRARLTAFLSALVISEK